MIGSRRPGLILAGMAFGWLIVFAFVVHTNQEQNVLTSKWQSAIRSSVQTLSPQQWAFFTKSPRDGSYEPYRVDEGVWKRAARFPHSRAENAFGWNRESRAQAIELGLIMSQLRGVSWHQCTQAVVECFRSAKADRLSTKNVSPAPTLCGLTGISASGSTPWAWAEAGQEPAPPRVTVVEITC